MVARLGEFRESSCEGGETPVSCLAKELARAPALEAGFADAGLVALPHAGEAREARSNLHRRIPLRGPHARVTERRPGAPTGSGKTG